MAWAGTWPCQAGVNWNAASFIGQFVKAVAERMLAIYQQPVPYPISGAMLSFYSQHALWGYQHVPNSQPTPWVGPNTNTTGGLVPDPHGCISIRALQEWVESYCTYFADQVHYPDGFADLPAIVPWTVANLRAAAGINAAGFKRCYSIAPVQEIKVTNMGTGFTAAPTIAITGGGGTGATAVATINGAGAVTGITVTSAGSGYTSAPTITISGAGGNGATAHAVMQTGVAYLRIDNGGRNCGVLQPVFTGGGGTGAAAWLTIPESSGGVITDTVMASHGNGYTSPPMVTVPNCDGAELVAVLQSGIDSIVVDNGGSGYQWPPAVAITGGGNLCNQATATATIQSGVASINVTNGGSGYTSTPRIAITGGGGHGAQATAVMWGNYIGTINVTSPGHGYTSAPSIVITGGGGTGAAATAILQSGLKSIHVDDGGSGYKWSPTVTITGGGGTMATAQGYLDPQARTVVTDYGLARDGDIVGSWLFNELREALNLLIWTFLNDGLAYSGYKLFWNNKGEANIFYGVGGYGGSRTWVQAKAEAEATFSGSNSFPESSPYAEAWGLWSTYYNGYIAQLLRVYSYLEWIKLSPVTCDCVFYYKAAMPTNPNGGNFAFDPNGDSAQDGLLTAADSQTISGSGLKYSVRIGHGIKPNWCVQPASGPPAGGGPYNTPETCGYTYPIGSGHSGWLLAKWNVSGGFTYVP